MFLWCEQKDSACPQYKKEQRSTSNKYLGYTTEELWSAIHHGRNGKLYPVTRISYHQAGFLENCPPSSAALCWRVIRVSRAMGNA